MYYRKINVFIKVILNVYFRVEYRYIGVGKRKRSKIVYIKNERKNFKIEVF